MHQGLKIKYNIELIKNTIKKENSQYYQTKGILLNLIIIQTMSQLLHIE